MPSIQAFTNPGTMGLAAGAQTFTQTLLPIFQMLYQQKVGVEEAEKDRQLRRDERAEDRQARIDAREDQQAHESSMLTQREEAMEAREKRQAERRVKAGAEFVRAKEEGTSMVQAMVRAAALDPQVASLSMQALSDERQSQALERSRVQFEDAAQLALAGGTIDEQYVATTRAALEAAQTPSEMGKFLMQFKGEVENRQMAIDSAIDQEVYLQSREAVLGMSAAWVDDLILTLPQERQDELADIAGQDRNAQGVSAGGRRLLANQVLTEAMDGMDRIEKQQLLDSIVNGNKDLTKALAQRAQAGKELKLVRRDMQQRYDRELAKSHGGAALPAYIDIYGEDEEMMEFLQIDNQRLAVFQKIKASIFADGRVDQDDLLDFVRLQELREARIGGNALGFDGAPGSSQLPELPQPTEGATTEEMTTAPSQFSEQARQEIMQALIYGEQLPQEQPLNLQPTATQYRMQQGSF